MNKRLTLKLILLLLSLSLISCGKKDIISKSNNETQSSIKKEDNNETQDTNHPELFSVAGEGLNKVPGICEYSLHEINITPIIKPSIITKNSSYYDVETADNIYIDVILDVYSLDNEAKLADDIITTKIKIKNNHRFQ